jgi:hypothetical protein
MEPTPVKNTGLWFGLIAGLVMVIYTLCLYLAGVDYFLGKIAWLGYILIITMAVWAGLRQKKANGGFLAFGEALKVVFMVFALGFLMQTLFSYVLFNYIDTGFRDALTQATLQKTEEFMKAFGATDQQIDKAMSEAGKKDNYSFGNVLLGYGIWCIVFFIVSLIIAAIIKKKKPPFENSFNQ